MKRLVLLILVTEKLVMDSILGLNKKLTIIIIAHRITTLQNCDKIIEIENGEISYKGTYDDIPSQKESKICINYFMINHS